MTGRMLLLVCWVVLGLLFVTAWAFACTGIPVEPNRDADDEMYNSQVGVVISTYVITPTLTVKYFRHILDTDGDVMDAPFMVHITRKGHTEVWTDLGMPPKGFCKDMRRQE